ncbi:MAG: hypothetical protein H0V75_13820 [Rubrobacter sp.]|nr:hypothetical protein [Rubrobacter sp.]
MRASDGGDVSGVPRKLVGGRLRGRKVWYLFGVIDRIEKSGYRFARSKSGQRFRDRFRHHQSKKRGRFHPARLFYIIGGLALILVSIPFGWLPVLGWGTVFLGLGMIAGEFYPAARLMDWLEVKARRIFRPVGRIFVKLPLWAQLATPFVVAILTFLLMFRIYSMTFGG